MPAPYYNLGSYAGFNPGQGLQDFANVLHQGYQDQQQLKEQQFHNLLQAQQDSAQYGAPGERPTVTPDMLNQGDLQQNVQSLAGTVNANRTTAPIYDARTGSYVQPPQGAQNPTPQQSQGSNPPPAATAPTPQARAAQAGLAQVAGPQDLKNDKAQPGTQSDGSFVAGNGIVIPAQMYAHYQQMGAQVDPDTGRLSMSPHDAYNLFNNFNKGQSSLASIGSRFLGNAGTPEKPTVVGNFRPAPAGNNKPPSAAYDSAFNKDPTIQGLERTISNSNATSDERADALAKLPAERDRVMKSVDALNSGGKTSGQKVKVSNGKQSFLIDSAHLADAQKDGYSQVQ